MKSVMIRLLAVVIFALAIAGCAKSTDNLIKELNSENPVTRLQAAAQLIGQKEKGTTGKLVSVLESGDERLVFIVAQILGSRADTTAIAPLGKVSTHPNPHIRARALWSIGSIGHESGMPYIVAGLRDSIPEVRHAAVSAIGFFHDAPSARLLYPFLRDEADSVRAAAIKSIYMYRKVPGAGVLAADLALAVNDPSPLVRYVAVQALGGGFPDSTIAGALLIEALRDENKHVRVEAINSIKNIRWAEAIPELKHMYDTATVDEEYSIAETIKAITGEEYSPESTLRK